MLVITSEWWVDAIALTPQMFELPIWGSPGVQALDSHMCLQCADLMSVDAANNTNHQRCATAQRRLRLIEA